MVLIGPPPYWGWYTVSVRLLRTFDCEDCGEPTERMRKNGQPLVCLECGIARAVDAAVELARAKGQGWTESSKYPKHLFQRGGRPAGGKNRVHSGG